MAAHGKIDLGVPLMDEDHARIDELLDAACLTPDDGLPALCAAVTIEVRGHFQREEDFLRDRSFPGLFCHVAQHKVLLADLARAGAGRGAVLRRQMESIIPQLIQSHVTTMDGMAAAFLKGELQASAFDILRLPSPESV